MQPEAVLEDVRERPYNPYHEMIGNGFSDCIQVVKTSCTTEAKRFNRACIP